MPIDISSEAINEKNKLFSNGTWLILLEINYPGEDSIYLVNNTEDITWNNKLWKATSFGISGITENKDGEVPKVQIQFRDPTRMLASLLDKYNGGIGASVVKRVVHSKNLHLTTPEVSYYFELLDTTVKSNIDVNLSLGTESLTNIRMPKHVYLKDHCRWQEFKGAECQYNGPESSCNRTYTQCQEYGNVHRFGGFPGMTSRGIQIG